LSGDGKSALVGEYAEFIYRTEQKKTRLYNADPGGWQTIKPYVDLGIIDLVDCLGYPYPWEWLDAISKGKVPTPDGKWVLDEARNADIGCYAFEGFTGIADVLMQDLARKAGAGNNVGGQAPPVKFTERETKVAGNSPTHYGTVQTQLTMACQESFHLGEVDIIWTALARRANDNDTGSPILGPQIVGKALTSEVPRWFVYTFRVMGMPADALTKSPERHILFFNDHTDINTPGAKGLGNSRIPLGSTPIEPIEPASLVLALETIQSKSREAEAAIRGRLAGIPLPNGRL